MPERPRDSLPPLAFAAIAGLGMALRFGPAVKRLLSSSSLSSSSPLAQASAVAECSRVNALRGALGSMDAFVVGSGDAHQSEYVAACDERRRYVSRFTGSAGTAVVTHSGAFLWTDGRYFNQAEAELGTDWQLKREGVDETMEQFVSSVFPPSKPPTCLKLTLRYYYCAP